MGKLLKTYLMPHPPIMVEEIGRGEEKKISSTIAAALKVAEEIKALKPDTIVMVVPPHGPSFGDAMLINTDKVLSGNLGNFGVPDVKFEFEADSEIIDAVIKNCDKNDIPTAAIDREIAKTYRIPSNLDHGAIVPLYYINKKYSTFKLVHITYGFLSNEKLYHFGRIIRESIEETDKRAVFIASGDLSHRLTEDAPNGFSPMGEKFDMELIEKLKESDVDGIMEMEKNLIESAGQCGYRSILVMLGALDGLDIEGEILSYEGPFGVGYCVAKYNILGENRDKQRVEIFFNKRKQRIQKIREKEDPYVRLARESLEYYLSHGTSMSIPNNLPEEMMSTKAGVFVSIKKDGELRGCIGTINPTTDNVAQEIINNAISAGINDPRFYPVDEDELDSLIYSVDVLSAPEPVKSKSMLDPAKYGVIVRSGRRSGLLLPNIEGVGTVDQQLKIALRKAGIGEGEHYLIERFTVTRHR